MNLNNSEEGQMIGMEDDIVKNEDLGRRSLMGRKRVKRRNNKRKMKGRKKKGKKGKRKAKKGKVCRNGKPLSGNQGPTCFTNKDCGPYGLCNGGDFEEAKPKWVFIKRCSCYKTKKIRNIVKTTFWLVSREIHFMILMIPWRTILPKKGHLNS
jgi:hypothetical protein